MRIERLFVAERVNQCNGVAPRAPVDVSVLRVRQRIVHAERDFLAQRPRRGVGAGRLVVRKRAFGLRKNLVGREPADLRHRAVVRHTRIDHNQRTARLGVVPPRHRDVLA